MKVARLDANTTTNAAKFARECHIGISVVEMLWLQWIKPTSQQPEPEPEDPTTGDSSTDATAIPCHQGSWENPSSGVSMMSLERKNTDKCVCKKTQSGPWYVADKVVV
eukprot:6276179-Amphidinium_carterae.1